MNPHGLRVMVLSLVAVWAACDTDAFAVEPSDASCVDVEVNGHRALSIDCLNRQLDPERTTDDRLGLPRLASEVVADMPSNQLGLFNRAATSVRMGNNFGRSAFPQRPPAPSLPSPILEGR